MSDKILYDNAYKYWEKGLSVIPLRKMDKMPIIYRWQEYADKPIPEDQKRFWLTSYPDANIGLALGPQSNVTIIDIDTDDERIIKAIINSLPPSPWVRIGRKGMALAYKYSGVRTFRLNTAKGERVVEYLSRGTQVVLPPSIHPSTKLPYTSNVELYTVLDELPTLPDNIEDVIRASLSLVVEMEKKTSSKFRYSEKISLGARDTKLNQHAGFAATKVLNGEQTLVQAMNNLQAWAEENVERVSGDEIDIEKGCRQIIGYLLSDVNTKNRILPTGWDEGLSQEQKQAWGLMLSEDKEEWTSEQILTYINKTFTEMGKDNPKRTVEVEFLLGKINKSKNLTTLQIGEILQTLRIASGLQIKHFKDRLKEMDKGEIEGLNHTEIALQAIKEFESKGYMLRYHNSEFYNWEGTHWEPLNTSKIWELIAREYGHLPAAKKASDHTGILKVMSQLLPKDIKTIDIDGVNFRNGFLTPDLRLVPHSPDFGMTYVMSYNYKPELADRAFKFEELIYTSWGHCEDYQEKRQALREAMAITMFGKAPSFQKAFLLYGTGQCGKSQVLEVISNLVPPEAKSNLAPDSWGEKFVLANLSGKLLNLAGELAEDKYIPGKSFKELIDGTPISSEFKFKDTFTFTPKAAHWFASNYLPKTRDTSSGFNRRWLMFYFDKVIPTKEQILDIGKIIVNEEIEAIAAWAIQTYPDVLKRGHYTLPKSHLYFSNELSLYNSIVRQWLGARISTSKGSKVDEDKLYNNFFGYCATSGHTKILQRQNFIVELDQFLSEDNRKNLVMEGGKRVYYGIEIKNV